MSFSIQKSLDLPFAAALERTRAALASEGFGILTTVDVRDTLKAKLGVAFRPYTILGACNPPLAHRALEADLRVGVMMPCNVVVYEDGPERTVVQAVDPMATMAAAANAQVREVAGKVREKLARALEGLNNPIGATETK